MRNFFWVNSPWLLIYLSTYLFFIFVFTYLSHLSINLFFVRIFCVSLSLLNASVSPHHKPLRFVHSRKSHLFTFNYLVFWQHLYVGAQDENFHTHVSHKDNFQVLPLRAMLSRQANANNSSLLSVLTDSVSVFRPAMPAPPFLFKESVVGAELRFGLRFTDAIERKR